MPCGVDPKGRGSHSYAGKNPRGVVVPDPKQR